MSLETLLTNLDNARGALVESLGSKGVTVASSATIYSCASAILDISTGSGTDVSSTTAEAGDVLSGKVFYNSGGSLTSGTIQTVSATSSGSQVTVPTGYIASSQTFNVSGGVDVSDTTAIGANVLSGYAFYDSAGVKTTGTIPTVSASRAAMNIVDVPSGYIAVEQSIVVGDLTSGGVITPATENQVISSGAFLDGSMTILGDSNLVASNILSGVSIFGVSGTLVTSGGAEVTLGYINSNGDFQPLAFSGIIPSDSGSAVDLPCYTWLTPNNSSGGSGGSSSGAVISSGYAYIQSGETWTDTTVNGGYFIITSGGVATGTTVNSMGHIDVWNGGTANSTIVNSYGGMEVDRYASANNITLNGGGLVVWGEVTSMINTGGAIYIREDGVANSTIINSSGWMRVSRGGTATDVTISSGGTLVIYADAVTSNVTSMTGAVIINS